MWRASKAALERARVHSPRSKDEEEEEFFLGEGSSESVFAQEDEETRAEKLQLNVTSMVAFSGGSQISVKVTKQVDKVCELLEF